MSEYITHSRAETVALGARMAAVLAPGSLVAFTGGPLLPRALPRALAAPTRCPAQPLPL